MVQVVEQHLVEAGGATQNHGHHQAHDGVGSLRGASQEVVPHVRVVDVLEHHPCQGEADAARNGHGKEHAPALGNRTPHGVGAHHPDAPPESEEEEVVLQALPEPLRVELAEGLGEARVPLEREEGTGVRGADEVPEGHQGQRDPALLQDVEPPCGIPTELAVLEKIRRGRVVLHVLHDDVLPRDGELVRPSVGDVGLPIVRGERRPVDDIVQAVHVLDAEPRHDGPEDERCWPVGQEPEQDQGIDGHHGALCRKEA
mmetsp:Transcript_38392/g.103964  ORF Transcript_38392/g.103964 Transcript_38392/m.103964 type:complete len:257 (+) Transcript_38392:799-1569(+)